MVKTILPYQRIFKNKDGHQASVQLTVGSNDNFMSLCIHVYFDDGDMSTATLVDAVETSAAGEPDLIDVIINGLAETISNGVSNLVDHKNKSIETADKYKETVKNNSVH